MSLIKLEEGKSADDYDFSGFPETRIGLSYIYYSNNIAGRRGKRQYIASSNQIALEVIRLYDLHPAIKFVRIAADASLDSDAAAKLAEAVGFANAAASRELIFIQGAGAKRVFDQGCYVGAIRPFIGASPDNDGQAYVYHMFLSHPFLWQQV